MSTNVCGIGYDSHRLVNGRKLVLAGVELSKEIGADAHSDGDALCHAVIDAVLGALGKPDIGCYFPDTDPEWKDASSIDMMKQIGLVVKEEKAEIIFVDVVVILESIKLRPYIEDMKSNICKALGLGNGRVNIKAKTNEKMGFLGRNEGVAVIATATVKRGF